MKFTIPTKPVSQLPHDLRPKQHIKPPKKHSADHHRLRRPGPAVKPQSESHGPDHDLHKKHPQADKRGLPKGKFDPMKLDRSQAGDDSDKGTGHRHHRKPENQKDPDNLHGRTIGKKATDAGLRGLGQFSPSGIAKHILNFMYPGSMSMAKDAKRKKQNDPAHRLNRRFNPLEKPMHRLRYKIKRDTHAGEGAGVIYLVYRILNFLRKLLLFAMMIVQRILGGLAHILSLVMGVIHAVGAVLGSVFGAVGSVFGVGAHVVGSIVAVGLAVVSIAGAANFFSAKDMENIGCAIQKVADDSSMDNTSGTSGEWTKKGSKAYNEAKSTYAAAKAQGCDDKHAAAVVGNAAHESGMFAMGLDVHQIGGGPGVGIFQFNNPPKDMSPSGQVKAIFANAPGRKGGWEKSSGSLSDLTNSFEEIFERGGIPDNGRRDALAAKAYQMFNGVGGSSAGDNDAAASNSSGCKGSGSGDDTGSDSDLISFGEKYLGLGYSEAPCRNQGGVDISEGKPKSQCAKTDCAGFVWGVMKHCHYKVSSGAPWTTGPEQHFSGCKHVSAGDTHAGTVLVENDNGDPHTGFLKEKWRGKQTKFLDEDGGSALGHCVGNNTYGTAFYGCFGTPVFLQGEKD